MRRISRLQRPIGLLNHQTTARTSSPYLCLVCKLQTSSLSTSYARSAPKTPYTEKIRQKIWGTDTPPGQEDPYGDASVFDRTKKGKQVEEQEEENEKPEEDLEPTEVEQILPEERKLQREKRRPQRYTLAKEPAPAVDDGGDLRWLRANPVWEPERTFQGFLPSKALTMPHLIAASLRRALVEGYALRQAGMPLESISSPSVSFHSDWTGDIQIIPTPTGATIQMSDDFSLQDVLEAQAAEITESEGGEAEFGVDPTEAQEDVEADKSEVDPLKDDVKHNSNPIEPQENVEADRSEVDPLGHDMELNEEVSDKEINANPTPEEVQLSMDKAKQWDPSWLKISLQDPEMKFAVMKRTMQLTGIRLPDSAIKSSNSAVALLRHLIARPKPRTLTAAIRQKGELEKLGNVTIHAKRRTIFEKEKDIGRLNAIEKELASRGLEPLEKKTRSFSKQVDSS